MLINPSRLFVEAPILQVLLFSILEPNWMGVLRPPQFRVQSVRPSVGMPTQSPATFSLGNSRFLSVRVQGIPTSTVATTFNVLTSGPVQACPVFGVQDGR